MDLCTLWSVCRSGGDGAWSGCWIAWSDLHVCFLCFISSFRSVCSFLPFVLLPSLGCVVLVFSLFFASFPLPLLLPYLSLGFPLFSLFVVFVASSFLSFLSSLQDFLLFSRFLLSSSLTLFVWLCVLFLFLLLEGILCARYAGSVVLTDYIDMVW